MLIFFFLNCETKSEVGKPVARVLKDLKHKNQLLGLNRGGPHRSSGSLKEKKERPVESEAILAFDTKKCMKRRGENLTYFLVTIIRDVIMRNMLDMIPIMATICYIREEFCICISLCKPGET